MNLFYICQLISEYMKAILQENKTYLFPLIVFIIIGITPHLFLSKVNIHLYINQFHQPIADYLFRYITHIGDGITIAIIGVILLFIRMRYAFLILAANGTSGLLAQFFKRIVFNDMARPASEIGTEQLHLIDGVQVLSHFSFPSGHTTAAFAFFTIMAAITKHKRIKILIFFLALLVSWSRVYLSHHFLIDIIGGAVLGTSIALISLYFFKGRYIWMNQSIQKAIKCK